METQLSVSSTSLYLFMISISFQTLSEVEVGCLICCMVTELMLEGFGAFLLEDGEKNIVNKK